MPEEALCPEPRSATHESCDTLKDGLDNSWVQRKFWINGLTSLPLCSSPLRRLRAACCGPAGTHWAWLQCPLFWGWSVFMVMETAFFLLELHLFLRETNLCFLGYWYDVLHPLKVTIPPLFKTSSRGKKSSRSGKDSWKKMKFWFFFLLSCFSKTPLRWKLLGTGTPLFKGSNLDRKENTVGIDSHTDLPALACTGRGFSVNLLSC